MENMLEMVSITFYKMTTGDLKMECNEEFQWFLIIQVISSEVIRLLKMTENVFKAMAAVFKMEDYTLWDEQ